MLLSNGDTDEDDRNIDNSTEDERNGREENGRIGDTNVEPGADRALVEENAEDAYGETRDTEESTNLNPKPRPRISVSESSNLGNQTRIAATPPPKPTPRRSAREKRAPDRYNDYIMNAIIPRPVDRKIQALDSLMNSGVLSEVSAEVAHRLIQAVMK